MTIIAQMIADRMIMHPTKHQVSALGKSRRMIKTQRGFIEAWTQRIGATNIDDVDVFVLKFAGRAGRAERATYHPMDNWSGLRADLWSINPPGYGGSSGNASVKSLEETSQAAFAEISRVAAGRPIIVMGNSLGTVMALNLAATANIAGLILRNPPPLRQLIVGEYGWWNGWVGAWLIAQKVPRRVCSIRNARQATCPAVFLSSGRDKTVPQKYHDKIINAYAGPKRVLRLENADHATALNINEQREYNQLLQWLRAQAIDTKKKRSRELSTVSG